MARPKSPLEWLQVDLILPNHPDTNKLVRVLGERRVVVLGHLTSFLCWVGTYAPDGNLSSFDDDVLAEAALWEGDSDVFVKAMIQAGFLDHEGEYNMTVHNWDERYGSLLARREQEASRQRTRRGQSKDVRGQSGDNSVQSSDNPGEPRDVLGKSRGEESRGEGDTLSDPETEPYDPEDPQL